MADTRERVVIIGAGPTGLALAAELQRLGTRSLLLDRLEAGRNTSRATVVHARTLEVLESLDLSEKLIDRGLILHHARLWEGDEIRSRISFDGLDTRYSFMLICPQDRTEAALSERLYDLCGGIHRPIEVTGIEPDPTGVTLTYVAAGVLVQSVRADWVVGCDGMHSSVREAAGIGFEGGDYEENFILADVEMDYPNGREHLDMYFSPEGFLLVAPLPENRFRVIATVPEGKEKPSLQEIQQVLDERGPREHPARATAMVWSSRFHIQHRVATRLRQDRVLLAGDAAHVHSPAGGQGMNTGIQDAVSLAGVLHTVLQTGDEGPLKEWEVKRLEVARNVVATTDRLTRLATSDSPVTHLLRNLALGLVDHSPALQHALAERLSEIQNR